MVIKFLFVMILSISSVIASDSVRAISDVSIEKGIQLSEKAKQNIGVKTVTLSQNSPFDIPSSALVYSRDKIGVYRLKNGWFKFIPVKILSRSANKSNISAELSTGEEIVIEGTALLRVSEMEAFAGEE